MTSDVPPSDPAPHPDTASSLAEDSEAFSQLLTSTRRRLHRNPEVGMREHNTHRLIRSTLEAYGLEVHGPIAETGLYVDIEGTRPGGRIGYRADIDALPADDAKQVAYRSRNGDAAHLCGHDAHTAIGIGVALALHQRRSDLCGAARVFFQPNEEGLPSGAPLMIRDGVLDGLDAVYAIHVDPSLRTGQYGLMAGPITASCDRFDVFVRHQGTGHSARPHKTVDTVWVASQIINALYQLVGRITDPRNATVLTVCRLFGGQTHNVIPDEVEFGGTLRTTSMEDRVFLRQKILQIAEHVASVHEATADVRFVHGAPPTVNNALLIRNVADTVEQLVGEHAIYRIPRTSMGGEDFAHYLKHVPGALIRVGTAAGPETSHPLHDARFDIDEAALAPTAQLMAQAMINYLDPSRLEDRANGGVDLQDEP